MLTHFVRERASDDNPTSWQIDSGRQCGRRHQDSDNALLERVLNDVALVESETCFRNKKTFFTTKMLLRNNVEVTGGIKSNTELPITEFYSVDILSKVLVWEKQL